MVLIQGAVTTTSMPQTGGCHYNGVTYWAGDSFRATDGCNTCYCSAHGGAMCTEMFCPHSKYSLLRSVQVFIANIVR